MYEISGGKGGVVEEARMTLLDGRQRPPLMMSEDDFLEWNENGDVRAEWVDGEVVLMSAESLIHIDLVYWVAMLLRLLVDRRQLGGRVIGSGFMVRLSAQQRVRIPDILYVSAGREGLVTATLLNGPPDVAIEVVSRESQSRDRREKFIEYERAGVREYWIIDPLSKTVEAYALKIAGAEPAKYKIIDEVEGRISSGVITGFYLKAEWLWVQPLPDVVEVLKGMGVQF